MKTPQFSSDPVTRITDDAAAKEIMLALGVLDQLSRKTHPTDTTCVYVADNHPTHWCMCARFWDNPDPAENGYMVLAYPKDQVDRAAVELLMQTYLEGSSRISGAPVKPFDQN
jgi:hypothetical protein